MLRHANVIRRHVDHIAEGAAAGTQYRAQVVPGGNELLFGIVNDCHVRRAADLAGAVQGVADPHGRRIARAFDDGLHGCRNDDFTV